MPSATGTRGPGSWKERKDAEDAGRSNCETGAHYGPEITGPGPPISRSVEQSASTVCLVLFSGSWTHSENSARYYRPAAILVSCHLYNDRTGPPFSARFAPIIYPFAILLFVSCIVGVSLETRRN